MYVATGRDLTALVKPPRALFVNHPMGNNFGPPNNPQIQAEILSAAMDMAFNVEVGGTLVDYPTSWNTPFAYAPGGKTIAQSKNT